MGVHAFDLPLIASYLVCTALAAFGFRTALARGGRGVTVLLVAGGVLLVQSILYARFTVDDSFITFRFAGNWAAGHGPVFQAGERVEGYTCFLWLALLSIAGRLGFEIELASKALGVVCALATLPAIAGIAQSLGAGPRAARLASLALALSPLFVAWIFAGMDAPLFAAMLAWAAWRFAAEARSLRARPVSAVLFGLLIWTRPEGILFAGIAMVVRLTAPGVTAEQRGGALRWALLCAAIAAPYWIWRWSYYGAAFPNTFYAKTGLGLGTLRRGLSSMADFAADAGALQILLVFVAAVGARWSESGFRFVFLSLAAFIAYTVWTGGDVLHLRFYVHILPLWMAAVALGLDRVLEGVPRVLPGWKPDGWRTALALGVVWAALGYHEHARARTPVDQFGASYVVDNSNNIHHAHLPLGTWLRANAPAGSRVAATDIGGLGYRSQLPLVDLYGLTDRAIARLLYQRAGAARLVEEVRSRNPEFFVLYGSSKSVSLGWLEADRRWIESQYRRHSFWPDSPRDKGLVLLARKDLRVARASLPALDLLPP